MDLTIGIWEEIAKEVRTRGHCIIKIVGDEIFSMEKDGKYWEQIDMNIILERL